MDDLTTDPAATYPPAPGGRPIPPAMPPFPGAPRAPGRPAGDPASRAAADAKYQELNSMLDLVPKSAKEPRFYIYRAHPSRDVRHPRCREPLAKVLRSEWESESLSDPDTLRAWLDENHGSDRYFIECHDNQGRLLDKVPRFVISTSDDLSTLAGDDSSMPSSHQRSGRPAWDRSDLDFDDSELDTPPHQRRANIGDAIVQSVKLQQEQATAATNAAARSSSEMMTMLMLMQEKQAEAQRLADERRREDEKNERRREEEREERRREERRAEEERRRAEEQRRWDAEREAIRAQAEQSSKRTELMLGIFTAAVPVLQKIMEPKPTDPLMATVLQKIVSGEKKETDPMTVMLLKSVLDKGQTDSSIQTMLASMGQLNQMSTKMMADSMTNLTTMQQKLSLDQMKHLSDMYEKRMELMEDKDDDEDDKPGTLGQIAEIVSTAANIVGLNKPQQPTGPGLPIAGVPQQQMIPMQQHSQQTMQRQPQAQPATPPLATVGACMKALHKQLYQNTTERDQILSLLHQSMPQMMQQAILAEDQSAILEQFTPVFMSQPELMAWVGEPGTVEWIQGFAADYREILLQAQQEAQQGAQQQAQGGQVAQIIPGPGAPGAQDDGSPVDEGEDGDDEDEDDDNDEDGDDEAEAPA